MKANAPEKIWVHELSAKELNVPLKEYHIEYIRTDAFIEKLISWLKEQEEMVGISFQEDFLERCKTYMKGE